MAGEMWLLLERRVRALIAEELQRVFGGLVRGGTVTAISLGGAVSGTVSVAWSQLTGIPTQYGGADLVIDGGGSAITTGTKVDVEVPYAMTISAARLVADQTGSIVVDVLKAPYATFPGSAASICASAKPTLSSAQTEQDTTLTGWTKTLARGDWLRISVSSATTVQRVTLSLTGPKT
jgi:hypothetical protein